MAQVIEAQVGDPQAPAWLPFDPFRDFAIVTRQACRRGGEHRSSSLLDPDVTGGTGDEHLCVLRVIEALRALP
jgi:hypothetical protein